MNKQTRVSHPLYNLVPSDIEGFDSLAALALDVHWSWNHATDEVWRQLDPELWRITHNPWVVLQTVSRDQIEHALGDPVFRKNIDGLIETKQSALYLMFNAGADAALFGLPPESLGTRWHLAADTDRETLADLFAAGEEPLWEDPHTDRLSPGSSAVLLARGTKGGGGNKADVTQARASVTRVLNFGSIGELKQ